MKHDESILLFCFAASIIVFFAALLNLFKQYMTYFELSALFTLLALVSVALFKVFIKHQKANCFCASTQQYWDNPEDARWDESEERE